MKSEISCRASAKDLDRDEDLFNTGKNEPNEDYVITKDFHSLPTWRSATHNSRDQMVLGTRVNRGVIFG